jgi:hypothetical protein
MSVLKPARSAAETSALTPAGVDRVVRVTHSARVSRAESVCLGAVEAVSGPAAATATRQMPHVTAWTVVAARIEVFAI